VEDDEFTGLDVADEFAVERVDSGGLGGEHVPVLQFADTERPVPSGSRTRP